jgi:site-specific DNA recombinase
VPIPAIIDAPMQEAVRVALVKHKVWSPWNVRHEYLLRGLVVCGECGWRMECAHQTRPTSRHEYFYYACRHHDPVETGRVERCAARRVRREELDGVVWEAVRAWIQTSQMLEQEVAAWRASDVGAMHVARDRARLERVERETTLPIERLIDAYQRGALSVEDLRGRREQLGEARTAARARVEELAAQDLDRTHLNRLADDLAAFASTLRAGLEKLDFAGRERLMRLLIERVVVTGEQVAIEHAIPWSGRFAGLRLQHRRARLPAMRRADRRAGDDRVSRGDPADPDAPRAVDGGRRAVGSAGAAVD